MFNIKYFYKICFEKCKLFKSKIKKNTISRTSIQYLYT